MRACVRVCVCSCLCVCVAGAPQNCSIVEAESRTSTSFTLTVTCFNGYAPITGYLLRFKKKTSSSWETRTLTATNSNPGAEKLVLRYLEANSQYEVQVKARNRHGYYDDLDGYGSDSFSRMKTVRTAKGG